MYTRGASIRLFKRRPCRRQPAQSVILSCQRKVDAEDPNAQLSPTADVELAIDASEVAVNRVAGDGKSIGDYHLPLAGKCAENDL